MPETMMTSAVRGPGVAGNQGVALARNMDAESFTRASEAFCCV